MPTQDNDTPKNLLPPATDVHNSKERSVFVRGALKLEASVSTPVVSAGEEFSIYVVIRNPFSESVTVYRTETHIPIKLSDEIWRKQYISNIKLLRRNKLRQIRDLLVGIFVIDEGERINISEGSLDGGEIILKNSQPETDSASVDKQNADSETTDVSKRFSQKNFKVSPIHLQDLIAKFFLGILLRLNFLLSDLWMYMFPEPGPRVAVAVGPEERKAKQGRSRGQLSDEDLLAIPLSQNNYSLSFEQLGGDLIANFPSGNNNVSLSGEIIKGNIVFNPGSRLQDSAKEEKEDSAKEEKALQNMESPDAITLSPGDSLVKHFVLKARGWLTFTPIAYTFQIQVIYAVNNQPHVDTVPFSLNIRAPMEASIIGSIIGSILGYIVSQQEIFTSLILNFNPQQLPNIILNLVRTIIFALIIIVAFARKSTVQQIVSVEDFWGGIFIGFLVGYSGDSFIRQFINAVPESTSPK